MQISYFVGSNPTATFKFLVILFLAFIIGCAQNPVTGEYQFMLISEEEEIGIGRNVAPQIEKEFGGVLENAELNNYVDQVGRKLVNVSHRRNLDYQFKVMNSDVPNAFALPGGHIYITRGLLIRLKNEAQLAGVLGHEIGHVAARHSASHISKSIATSVLLQAGLVVAQVKDINDEQIKALAIVGGVVANLVLLGYSRDHEYQSDELGAEYTYRSGYNPKGMLEVLHVLLELEKEHGGKTPEFLMTHPKSKNRIDEIEQQLIIKFKDADMLPTNQDAFLKGTESFRNSHEAYRKYDRAIQHRSHKNLTEALSEINSAIEMYSGDSSFHAERGKIYEQMGNKDLAKANYSNSLKLNENNFKALVGLGRIHVIEQDYQKAQNHLAKAATLVPQDPEPHYYLSELYNRTGRYKDAREQYNIYQGLTQAGKQN